MDRLRRVQARPLLPTALELKKRLPLTYDIVAFALLSFMHDNMCAVFFVTKLCYWDTIVTHNEHLCEQQTYGRDKERHK